MLHFVRVLVNFRCVSLGGRGSMESLLDAGICRISKPQKRSLFTNGSLPHIPPGGQSECLSHILTLVEKTLFTWADWSVALPPSQLTPSLNNRNETPDVGSLFLHQDFEEYQVLAVDEQHRSRRLNARQLLQLRNYGRFDVACRKAEFEF